MRKVPDSNEGGYTLTELVIVIGLLALLVAVAVPGISSSEQEELDLAAAEFAAAIRFARSESIRTGEPHGFRFLTNQYRIRVFRTDTSGTLWTWIWDVYHPIEKGLYDYTLPPELAVAPQPVVHTPIYRGTCNRQGAIYFDSNGTPRCLEPETVLLESYRLDFTGGQAAAAVTLDGITGRVTVQ